MTDCRLRESLLGERYRFKEAHAPCYLTESQVEARNVFLNEIYKKNKYIPVSECPYCGKGAFRKISEVDKRCVPSDIVICESCDGCFNTTVLTREGTKFHYEKISHILTGKKTSETELKARMDERVRLFAYARYKFISHFAHLMPGRDLVVELGCNDGANLVPWKENGFSVLGVDLDSKLVEFGKKLGLNLVKGDILYSEITGERPKLIILSRVLDHVADVNLALEKVKGMLDPDGYVYIEVPGIRFDGLVDPLKYFDSECNFYFDLKTITGLLKKHNLNIKYADENIRVLCSLSKGKDNGTVKQNTMSLAGAKAYLFKRAMDVLEPRDSGLYDLLKRSESNNLRMRFFRKLRRMYFAAYYGSLAGKQKVGYGQA